LGGGFPVRFVAAMSRNSSSLIDFSMDRAAPFRSLTFYSPRLADSAAPAAFRSAWNVAGISASVSNAS
jgi:hypothetical protein